MKEFDGQVVVITGASRGLGLGCAQAFAARGAEVVLVSRSARRNSSSRRRADARGRRPGARRCPATSPTRRLTSRHCSRQLPRCDVLDQQRRRQQADAIRRRAARDARSPAGPERALDVRHRAGRGTADAAAGAARGRRPVSSKGRARRRNDADGLALRLAA
jgi:NAD(P)-dependent dehydrogenase (short-subunit alcohol dehydrogenase family)